MEGIVLIHHGIKGQKWGVENGPPYPLAYKDYSSSEKKKNPQKIRKEEDKIDKKNANLLAKKHLKSKKKNTSAVDKEFAYKSGKMYEKTAIELHQKGYESYIQRDKDGNANNIFIRDVLGLGMDEANKSLNQLGVDLVPLINSYIDDWGSAMLKDIGYEDTKEGTDYIKKLRKAGYL